MNISWTARSLFLFYICCNTRSTLRMNIKLIYPHRIDSLYHFFSIFCHIGNGQYNLYNKIFWYIALNMRYNVTSFLRQGILFISIFYLKIVFFSEIMYLLYEYLFISGFFSWTAPHWPMKTVLYNIWSPHLNNGRFNKADICFDKWW
jgi:hypothetical protein